MSAPTPGPWEARGASIYAPNAPRGRRSDGTQVPLAELYRAHLSFEHQSIGAEMPELHANARIMAASLEMLAALHEMLAAHQREDPHHEDLCSNCRSARAAIAKAEGPR